MSDQDKENLIFREEMDKQNKLQSERDFLKDKSIGGNAPRPSDDFIDRSLGKDQNRQERAHTANEVTDRRMAQERSGAKHRQEVERSHRAHQKHNVEGVYKETKYADFADSLKQKRSQAQDRKHKHRH